MIRQWIKRKFKFGEKWFAELIYKRADELQIGDELVIPRLPNNCENVELPEVATLYHSGDNLTNIHADHLSYNQHRLTIPRYVDEKFAELFGFMIGDGWMKQANNYIIGVCWALGEYEDINSKYESLLQSYGLNPARRRSSGSNSNLLETVCDVSSTDFGLLMSEIGFCFGFDKKRIPDWVYRAKLEIKIAFIHGLVDADGSSNIDKWNCERIQLELSNYELVKDAKALLHQIGWKCGNIIKRYRDSSTVTINDQECERSDSWIIYFYKSDLFESAGKHVQRESGSRGHDARKYESGKYGTNVVFEPIISIEDGCVHETADVQVEHEASNFIADGVVVHNSVIDGGRRASKQLRLMEDAALIYRISRAPERRKFTIPVGLIPPKEVPEYMQMVARTFKRQRFYNPATGAFDERYSPLIQEDDYFLPRRPDGTGPDVETLPGGENVDKIADIEYFKKKMIAPTKIPFARAGIGDGAGEASEKSLSQSHAEFAKAVQWVQRAVSTGLTKTAIAHLSLRGYSVEDLRGFELSLTASSAMEELYRIETWQTRVGVMSDLKELGWFPKEWIVTHFTDLSPDEIQELKEAESDAASGGGGLGGGGGGGDMSGDIGDGLGNLEAPGDEAGDENSAGGAAGGVDELDADIGIEGFDRAAERRLLNEIKTSEDVTRMRKRLDKWAHNMCKSDVTRTIDSGFDGVISSKELDGLSAHIRNDDELSESGEFTVFDPNVYEDELLVEWSVDKVDRDQVISEVYNILMQDAPTEKLNEDEDITPGDISAING